MKMQKFVITESDFFHIIRASLSRGKLSYTVYKIISKNKHSSLRQEFGEKAYDYLVERFIDRKEIEQVTLAIAFDENEAINIKDKFERELQEKNANSNTNILIETDECPILTITQDQYAPLCKQYPEAKDIWDILVQKAV